MQKRMRSVWITQKLTPLFGINLCGFESDRQGVVAEIAAVEEELHKQLPNSMLTILDIAFTDMMPEVVAFINAHPCENGDPIRKLAIVGVSDFKKKWYHWFKKVNWPKNARFFDGHEPAKAWLLGETY